MTGFFRSEWRTSAMDELAMTDFAAAVALRELGLDKKLILR
jgi:hypothetical protein